MKLRSELTLRSWPKEATKSSDLWAGSWTKGLGEAWRSHLRAGGPTKGVMKLHSELTLRSRPLEA
eukprot:9478520-Alexandrium_andersonii.AAC.1